MSRIDHQFKLRIPIKLKKIIEESAKDNKRSINAEIISRLENDIYNEAVANSYLENGSVRVINLEPPKINDEIFTKQFNELYKELESIKKILKENNK